MKYLIPKPFNDLALLDALAISDTRIGIILKRGTRGPLASAYAGYFASVANPAAFVSAFRGRAISADLLVDAYESPPVAVSALKIEVQTTLSPNVCPMCGSLKSGTADHYFPKRKYPEFAIYSWNLVPACDCNTKRGEVLFGPGLNDRIIHPFFERGLTQRIITVNIDCAGAAPILSIGKHYPPAIAAAAIDFHVKEVHAKTTMLDWVTAEWARLLELPMDSMSWYPTQFVSYTDIKRRLEELRMANDRKLGTPNNWASALFDGVISSLPALNLVRVAVNKAVLIAI